MPAAEVYTLEEAEDHIGDLRGKVDVLGERIRTNRVIAEDPATPGTDESWHSLGSLGAHYTVTRGRYRLTTDNCVELDIEVIGDGLQATSVTFANSLPAAYTPVSTHQFLPMGTNRAVTATDVWPRVTVTSAGAVTVNASAVSNTFATCVRVPLD